MLSTFFALVYFIDVFIGMFMIQKHYTYLEGRQYDST
jgi:hypothetical protein